MSVMTAPTKRWSAAIPSFPVCRMSVDEYHRFIEAGVFGEDDKVELLEGWIAPKMPQNKPHKFSMPKTQYALLGAMPAGWYVAVQQPVATDDSEPEPDFSIPRGQIDDYPDGTPDAANVALLVEVSDSSLEHDRVVKSRIFARAKYPVYWIVNIPDRKVEVYTDPTGAAEQPCYRQQRDYSEAEAVPFVIENKEVARIPVRTMLP